MLERYFHKFGSNKVDIDVCLQEASDETLQALQRAHAPPVTVMRGFQGSPDLPSQANRFAPNFLLDVNKLSELLEVVNSSEGIDRSFVFDLQKEI